MDLNNANGVLVRLVEGKNDRVKKLFSGSLGNYTEIEEVGTLFEKSLEQMERKGTGQFYTPSDIVQYIINHLPIKPDSKILDPACGCGSFLLGLFDTLRNKHGLQSLKNIYGVDLNHDAVNITRFSLFIKSGYNKKYLKTLTDNIQVGNSIVANTSIDKHGFNWNNSFSSIMNGGGFDYIIGNPPYVTLSYDQFDSSEATYSNIINGPVNAASLMIIRSLNLLKKNGMLAFLLPKSILYVHSYDLLRKFILDNAKILQIFDLGQKFPDVRGEQIILILQKKKPKINSDQTLIRILKNKDESLTEQPSFRINQKLLTTLNNFLALDRVAYYKIIKNLKEENESLNDLVSGHIFRGLPIGGNSPKISERPLSNSTQVLRGCSIAKFKIKSTLYLKNDVLDDHSENKINSLMNKKIVLQNIFSSEAGTIAAYDSDGTITLDTVTNILVDNDSEGKFLLGLLNSKLVNFFIMYALFNRSRLTMHMDKTYLASIPVKQNPDKQIKRKIVSLVEKAISESDITRVKKLNGQIDEKVFQLYEINAKQSSYMESAVNCLLSEKSRW